MLAPQRLSAFVLEAVTQAAFEHFPEECCGVLLARARAPYEIVGVMPARNLAPSRRRHFIIEPAVLVAAQRKARETGLRIAGFYHSHPMGVARPSPADLEGAVEPCRLWLIAAPQNRANAISIAAYERVGEGAQARFRNRRIRLI